MKVYVDEKDIELLNDLFEATNCYECWAGNMSDDLEIVSLVEHDKQVRNKIIELARKRNNDQFYIMTTEILDQIQGEK